MTLNRFHIDGGKVGAFVAGAVLAALAFAAGAAYASDGDTIHACVDKKGKVKIVNSASDCKEKKETLVEWSIQGPKGDDGAPGTNGTNGEDGEDGANGAPGTNGTNGSDGADGVADFYTRTIDSVCPGGSAICNYVMSCFAGDEQVSGGHFLPGFGYLLLRNEPLGETEWQVGIDNTSGSDLPVTTYIRCADLTP